MLGCHDCHRSKKIQKLSAIKTKHAGLYKRILYVEQTLIMLIFLMKSNVDTLLNLREKKVLVIGANK